MNQTLQVLMNIRATLVCVGLCRELGRLDIALDHRKPLAESFRTSGMWFYNHEGTSTKDSETVFNCVYRG